MTEDEPFEAENDSLDEANPPRIVDAGKLFGDSREIWIELDGVRYRLRITRRNKLILQK
ncbi:MAG: hemin uptake protein HemP [Planctomycetes bacterium]|nr:hemin uptake protein HemP [Planctomycetota bacterium]